MRGLDFIPEDELKQIDQVIVRYKEKHGSLIPALKESQVFAATFPNRSRGELPND